MKDKDILDTGEKAPDFCLLNQNDEEVCLNDITGK
jgi:peroxiredoxin